jgi:3-oxoacyl-[acyl-carrier-protein] synthase-1
MKPLSISAYTVTSAIGTGLESSFNSIANNESGLKRCTFDSRLDTFTGMVAGLDALPVAGDLADFDCRNNRLAQLSLQQDDFVSSVERAKAKYGADRIAVILGTSTSGIQETELAYLHRDKETDVLPADFKFSTTHNLFATSDFVRQYLGLTGHASMISTACSSAAKAFASAWRMMKVGLCDAAVVGGADSLALNTLYGFSSLELVAITPCRPCSPDRSGISIGEAAGFALLEWPENSGSDNNLFLKGYGESSDAYHMSTPRPDGSGAALAMAAAIKRAAINPGEIDYINMHGTASDVNDSMEDKAITRIVGTSTPSSATKGWTGHTLGTAGMVEAAISLLAMEHGLIPGTQNTQTIDPSFTSNILLDNRQAELRNVLSNSFGFGGSNCSLLFGKGNG